MTRTLMLEISLNDYRIAAKNLAVAEARGEEIMRLQTLLKMAIDRWPDPSCEQCVLKDREIKILHRAGERVGNDLDYWRTHCVLLSNAAHALVGSPEPGEKRDVAICRVADLTKEIDLAYKELVNAPTHNDPADSDVGPRWRGDGPTGSWDAAATSGAPVPEG